VSALVSMASPAQVESWRREDRLLLVDVREESEHQAEAIPGAINMPLSTFDPRLLPDPAGRHLVLHCQSGVRCGMVAEILQKAGYGGAIHRLEGGMLGWKAAGGPTRTAG